MDVAVRAVQYGGAVARPQAPPVARVILQSGPDWKCSRACDVRLVLEVLTGSRMGQRILLARGDCVRIGRTPKANIVFADDGTMSGEHFAAECRPDGCRVRDLNSLNGLSVNGQRVSEMTVGTGDRIRAGSTQFAVTVLVDDAPLPPGTDLLPEPQAADESSDDGDSTLLASPEAAKAVTPKKRETDREGPPPEMLPLAKSVPPPKTPSLASAEEALGHSTAAAQLRMTSIEPVRPLSQMTGEALDCGPHFGGLPPKQPARAADSVHRFQPSDGARLYAIVNGATAMSLVDQAKHLGLRVQSLLQAGVSPYLGAVAPYLVEINQASGFLSYWSLWLGKNSGLLIESADDFDLVLGHFRHTFAARDAQGHDQFFRFYDHRVLRDYLSGRAADELRQFFGPASLILSDSEEAGMLLCYSLSANGLVVRRRTI